MILRFKINIIPLVIGFSFLSSLSFAQKEQDVKIVTEISGGINPLFGFFPGYENLRGNLIRNLNTHVNIGIALNVNNNSQFRIMASYQFECNMGTSYAPFAFQKTHFLGVDLRYAFNNEKRLHPFFGINLATSINSNYNYKTIDKWNQPTESPQEGKISYIDPAGQYMGGPDHFRYYYSKYYYSTPFIGSIYFGFEMRITKGLNLQLSLENIVRILRSKTLWLDIDYENADFDHHYFEVFNDAQPDFKNHTAEELLRNKPIETTITDNLGIRLGISYTFPFKKEKPQPQ